MKIPDSLRRRDPEAAPGNSSPTGEDQLPISRYDRLKPVQIAMQLHHLSQAELETIEDYERSHGDRREVLDKLRYLRGDQPLPDYDGLDAKQVATALESADLHTMTRAREYELKFHRRPDVLEELARVRHERKLAGMK